MPDAHAPGGQPRSSTVRRTAAWAAVLYFVGASIYIIVSDFLVVVLANDSATVHSLKGVLFILLTAIVTYVLITRSGLAIERSHERLRESEARLRRIIDTTPDAVITLDRGLCIGQWNRAAHALFGWSAAEARGKPFLDLLIVEEQRAVVRGRLDRALAGEVLDAAEGQAHTRERGPRWIRWMASALQVDGGDPELLVIAEDITERRELGERMRQAQKMEAVGQLAGGVAHDFNNILTAIIGHTELLRGELRQRIRADDVVHGDLDTISAAAERAALLTRQLLAFSRQQVLHAQVLSPNRIIDNLVPMLRRLLPENVELVRQLGDEVWCVQADATQLEQVLLNLAINARDAMPRGGRLVLETRNITVDEEGAAAARLPRAGAYVRIAVSDNGCGMTAATRARIFEPFFTTKGVGKGTGLGLSTVLGIVEQSGGHISVYSEPNRGSTFRVYLPAVTDGVADEAVERGGSAALGGSETIAVCEDDGLVRDLACRTLERHGYAVISGRQGDEMLELLRVHAGRIDLLVTDVVMPGIHGLELARRVRAQYPEVAVLFVSGYTADIMEQQTAEEAVEFLEKPFAPRALLQRVREVLDHHAAMRSDR